MKKIVVFNNFGDDRRDWIKRISKQSPSGTRWNNIELVEDAAKADFAIILDGASGVKREEVDRFKEIPKIFLQREPEQVQGPLKLNKDKFVKFITYDTHATYCDWWLDYDYSYLLNLKYEDVKKTKQNPACIISSKTFTNGQAKRIKFLQQIQNKIDIDFYGRPDLKDLFDRYLAPPEHTSKTSKRDKSILFEHHTSFALENGSRKNFLTRLSEELLCWTMPIYWGCPNIEDLFPEHSYRYVNIEGEFSIEELEYLIRKPEDKEIKAMAEARDLILNKYNFFPYIESILNN